VKDVGYVEPQPVTQNNVKDRIQTEIAKIDDSLLQNVWHEVDYRLDVCGATNRAHAERAQRMKKLSELLFTTVCV
jgi:hypothetical protein